MYERVISIISITKVVLCVRFTKTVGLLPVSEVSFPWVTCKDTLHYTRSTGVGDVLIALGTRTGSGPSSSKSLRTSTGSGLAF